MPLTGVLEITPNEVADAGKRFASGVHDIDGAHSHWSSALSDTAGMAGSGSAAEEFIASYDANAAAAAKLLTATIDTCGGIARGMIYTANLYAESDHASDTHSSGSAQTWPAPGLPSALCQPPAPRSSGGGHSSVPSFLQKCWPSGDPDKLRAAGDAWKTLGTSVRASAGTLSGHVNAVTASNDEAGLKKMNALWDSLTTAGGSRAVFNDLPDTCDAVHEACHAYADAIESTRHKMTAVLAGLGVAVGLTTALGVLGSVFTLGASDAGAAAADSAEVGVALGPLATAFAVAAAGTLGAMTLAGAAHLGGLAAAMPIIEAGATVFAEVTHAIEGEFDDEGKQRSGGPTDESEVRAEVQSRTAKGKNPPNRQVDSEADLRELYEELGSDGTPAPAPPGYGERYGGNAEAVRLPDGTEIRFREGSSSGGSTIDIQYPSRRTPVKIHIASK